VELEKEVEEERGLKEAAVEEARKRAREAATVREELAKVKKALAEERGARTKGGAAGGAEGEGGRKPGNWKAET